MRIWTQEQVAQMFRNNIQIIKMERKVLPAYKNLKVMKERMYLFTNGYYVYVIGDGNKWTRIGSDDEVELLEAVGEGFVMGSKTKWAYYRVATPQQVELIMEGKYEGVIVGIWMQDKYLMWMDNKGNISYVAQGKPTPYTCSQPNILHSPYKGTHFINPLHHTLLKVSFLHAELYCINGSQNGIYNIQKVKVEDHVVKASSDGILNLRQMPLNMNELHDGRVMMNAAHHLVVWGSAIQSIQLPYAIQMMTRQKDDVFWACSCRPHPPTTIISTLSFTPEYKMERLHKVCEEIITIMPCSERLEDGFGLSSGLEVLGMKSVLKGERQVLLPNHTTTITHAQLLPNHNLLLHKETGYRREKLLYTKNQVIPNYSQYSHNMLVQVSTLIYQHPPYIYLTSPIIGTLSLSITYQQQFIIEAGQSYDECIQINQHSRITPTHLYKGTQAIQLEQLLEGCVQSVGAACIVGGVLVLAIREQLHFYHVETLKRMFIECMDQQVRVLVPLNHVHVLGVQLWSDHTLKVYTIGDEGLQLMKSIEVNGSNVLVRDHMLSINAVPFVATVIGEWLILCASQPHHKYQSNVQILTYEFKSAVYPVISLTELSHLSLLVKREQSWMICRLPNRHMLRDVGEIMLQFHHLVGFPPIHQRIILAAAHHHNWLLLCEESMVLFTLVTGSVQVTDHLEKSLCGDWEGEGMELLVVGEGYGLLHNETEIWYVRLGKPLERISYFTRANNPFLEFRNNLTVEELEDDEFMGMFATHLKIICLYALSSSRFVLLYEGIVVILAVGHNMALIIEQQISLPLHYTITSVIGMYDQHSPYLVDQMQQLFLLKYQHNKYSLQLLQSMEEEHIIKARVKGWSQPIQYISINGQLKQKQYEEISLKKDGEFEVGKGKVINI